MWALGETRSVTFKGHRRKRAIRKQLFQLEQKDNVHRRG